MWFKNKLLRINDLNYVLVQDLTVTIVDQEAGQLRFTVPGCIDETLWSGVVQVEFLCGGKSCVVHGHVAIRKGQVIEITSCSQARQRSPA